MNKKEYLEEWVPFIEEPSLYEVSNLGNVRRIEDQKVLTKYDADKRIVVNVKIDNRTRSYTVATAIMKSFGMQRPHSTSKIVYKDGDYTNLKLTNLKWFRLEKNEVKFKKIAVETLRNLQNKDLEFNRIKRELAEAKKDRIKLIEALREVQETKSISFSIKNLIESYSNSYLN